MGLANFTKIQGFRCASPVATRLHSSRAEERSWEGREEREVKFEFWWQLVPVLMENGSHTIFVFALVLVLPSIVCGFEDDDEDDHPVLITPARPPDLGFSSVRCRIGIPSQ